MKFYWMERQVERLGLVLALPFRLSGELLILAGDGIAAAFLRLPCWLRFGHKWSGRGGMIIDGRKAHISCTICGVRKAATPGEVRALWDSEREEADRG